MPNSKLKLKVKGFDTWNAYLTFCREVTGKFRYAYSDGTIRFIESLLATCEHRDATIQKDSHLWRARLGSANGPPIYDDGKNIVDFVEILYESEGLKSPPAEKTRGDRVTPKGIPCLYLCSHKGTAMAEVNPYLGKTITVAKFAITRNLKVIDFMMNGIKGYDKIDYDVSIMDYLWRLKGNLTQDEINQTVWLWLDRSFTKPVNAKENEIEYVPTQIIAEYLKANSYDGIKYKSAKGTGYNLALFDVNSAEPISGQSELYDCVKMCMCFKRRDPISSQAFYEFNTDSKAECIGQ